MKGVLVAAAVGDQARVARVTDLTRRSPRAAAARGPAGAGGRCRPAQEAQQLRLGDHEGHALAQEIVAEALQGVAQAGARFRPRRPRK